MLATLARLATATILGLTLVACAPSGTIVNVTIDGGDRTIVLGDALTLTVTPATPVTWTSSDETVATIDATGNVDSLTDGATDLTATSVSDPTKSDTITLTINPQGELRWTRQFGTGGTDYALGIATDASANVYATGYTLGALEGRNAGGWDAFIRSNDRDGNLRWTRQFGTSSDDIARGIAADANANVTTSGYTTGALEGPNAGSEDAFVRAYDPDGNLRWTRQFGPSSSAYATGIDTDANGNVYTTGTTGGALTGASAGGDDAFVRSYGR